MDPKVQWEGSSRGTEGRTLASRHFYCGGQLRWPFFMTESLLSGRTGAWGERDKLE